MLGLEVDDAMSSDASIIEFEIVGFNTHSASQIRGGSKRCLGLIE